MLCDVLAFAEEGLLETYESTFEKGPGGVPPNAQNIFRGEEGLHNIADSVR